MKKNRILLVLQYIWENSDEEHPVKAKDIIAFLEENGISATSRTIKSDVDQLIDFGIDIEIIHSTQNRYFMYERNFELAEIKLLIDAVQSARFITEKKSKRLIKKLSAFVSKYQRKELKRQLYIEDRIKTENDSVYYSVDSLHTAIQNKKKVSFKYIEITPDKFKKEKNEGKIYIFSPYALVWNDDFYYAIGYYEGLNHNDIVKFRVDRMKFLNIIDAEAIEQPADFQVENYFVQMFSMYDGPQYELEILCENELMKYVIDKFGEGVDTRIVDKEHFVAKIKVNLSPAFYAWVFSFSGRMKINVPQEAIEGFEQILKQFKLK